MIDEICGSNEKNINGRKENTMAKDETFNTVEAAIETRDLETVLRTAPALNADLKEDWPFYAAEAIENDFPDLLKYLQEELKVDFSEEIGALSFENRMWLDDAVRGAALCGQSEIVEYAVKEFRSPQTFNAAFIGAVRGHQLNLLWSLATSRKFKIGNALLKSALSAAWSEGHEDTVDFLLNDLTGNKSCLERDAYGNDALDHLVDKTLDVVSQLITGSKYESDKRIGTVEKAEQIVRLLKEHCRSAERGMDRMLFQTGKKFLRDPEMQLPDIIKTEIMRRSSCPWLEPGSDGQPPSRVTLVSRLKFVRKTLINEHYWYYWDSVSDHKNRRRLLHSLISAYQDAGSIAEFHRLAPIYAERILSDHFFGEL